MIIISDSNKLYDSAYKETAWDWLKGGMSPAEVVSGLKNMGFSVSLPVVYRFKQMMEEQEELDNAGGFAKSSTAEENSNLPKTVDPEQAVKNDAQLLDLIINAAHGMYIEHPESVNTSPQLAIKAIELKRTLMGKNYSGHTLWGVDEYKRRFKELMEVINMFVRQETWDLIIDELIKRGWGESSLGSSLLSMDDKDEEEG